ncbi:morn5 [Symbiodinium microadriaticum]|nr:morn5 [Symbiodinium microadriaticum]
MTEGAFYFADGLQYEQEEEWTYCSPEDRRFKAEIDLDTEAEREEPGPLVYTTPFPDQPPLPYNCYDVHTGYYDPEEDAVMSYATGDKLRDVDEAEKEWILTNCRKGTDPPAMEGNEQ